MSGAHYTITSNDNVRLEMSRDDFDSLLLALGYAAGAAHGSLPEGNGVFWKWIGLVNRLNTGNPGFTPYEIPMEFQKPQGS